MGKKKRGRPSISGGVRVSVTLAEKHIKRAKAIDKETGGRGKIAAGIRKALER